MRRREFIGLLGGATTWPLAARAQAPKNIPRLCFITFDPATSRSTRFGAFFQGLVDLGYVDGKTITIDYLSADGHGDLLRQNRKLEVLRVVGPMLGVGAIHDSSLFDLIG